MSALADPLQSLLHRLQSLTICTKIIIGNSLVIVVGAVGGTWITRHIAAQTADFWLIAIFAGLGISLSIVVNYFIVRAALRPLDELREFVDQIRAGEPNARPQLAQSGDPNVCQLAIALNTLIHQLENSNRQLKAISQRTINAQEEERKRIARSLHDDTNQALSSLIIQLERLEQQSLENQEIQGKLSTARSLAADILNDLQKTVLGLRPAILDDLGLAPAIRWYARSNLEEAGILVDVDLEESDLPLSPELKTTLFRISQEAINNIRQHSKASKARITLQHTPTEVYLRIEDNGCGFAPAPSEGEAARLRQWGLVGIQERVDLVGGSLALVSEPGHGAMLQISTPRQISEGVPDG